MKQNIYDGSVLFTQGVISALPALIQAAWMHREFLTRTELYRQSILYDNFLDDRGPDRCIYIYIYIYSDNVPCDQSCTGISHNVLL